MGDDQVAVVEHGMADQAVQKFTSVLAPVAALLGGDGVDLGDCLIQAVGDADALAAEPSGKFLVVVARYGKGSALLHHGSDKIKRFDGAGAAISQVADEEGFAAFGMRVGSAGCIAWREAKAGQQGAQLMDASVNVADDVERAVLVALVAPKLGALNPDGIHVGGGDRKRVAKALLGDVARAVAAQILDLTGDSVWRHDAVYALRIAIQADALWHVEDDGSGEDVLRFRQIHQHFARFGLDVGGVHDDQLAALQALGGDVMEHIEGVGGGGLVELVVGHPCAARIRREHFGGLEVFAGEGAFAAAARADQGD